jgi:uncharacterized protein (TIGR02996 family)
MTTEEALLAAILAHPDEDTPRLAYADWLDENGDESGRARAEFIRGQIEVARLPDGDRRRAALVKRCAELERAHPEWLAPFHQACASSGVTLEFRRGFVGRARGSVDAPAWFAAVARLCPVQELSFLKHATPDPAAWAAVADCPALVSVRRIDFDMLPIPVAREFFRSPYLVGLRSLRSGWTPAESIEAVACGPAAASLRELRVSGGYSAAPPGSGLRVLLSAEWPALEDLRVDRCEVGDAGARQLAAECAARGRRRLHVNDHHERLSGAGARDAAEAALGGAPGGIAVGRPALREGSVEPPAEARELWLGGFHGEGDAFAGWVRNTVPPGRFDRLAITGCRMNASGAVVLSAWEGLAHLTELDLSGNWIGDLGAFHLAESPYLDRVEAVFVAHNDITKRGKDALKKRFGRRVRVS